MKKIIKADLRRIIKKKNLWVFLILSCIVTIGLYIKDIIMDTMNSFNFMTTSCNCGLFTLFIGSIFLLAIYGDEFRSKAMTTIIGRGFSRTRIVLIKFIDTVILTSALFLFLTIFTVLMEFILRVHMNPIEIRAILYSFIIAAYNMIGAITIAALFMYITENITLGIFIYVMMNLVVPLVLQTIRQFSEFVQKYNLDRYNYYSIGQMANADFTFGLIGDGILKLAAGLIIFVGTVLVITIVYFNRKELDF